MEEQKRQTLRKIAGIITVLKKAVFSIYEQDYHNAKLLYNGITGALLEILQCMQATGSEAGNVLRNSIEFLKEKGLKDIMLFGDIVEKNLIPSLEQCAYEISGDMQIVEGAYCIESTSSGYFTIQKNHVYLHNNDNPMIAAWHLVRQSFSPDKESYAVFGCGLGYHVLELYRISMGSVPIFVYESDEKMIQYAYEYGVLSEIPDDVLRVIHDPDMMEFLLHCQNEKAGMLLHLPTIQTMGNKEIRIVAQDLYIQWNTDKQFRTIQQINRIQNRRNCDKYLEDVPCDELHHSAVVVAAGPSLDEGMTWLKDNQGKMLIVAVSTVFRKLLKAGIRPDYIVVMDPQQRTVQHMDGLMQETVPMVIAPDAYWEFAKKYQGTKYMASFRQAGHDKFNAFGTVTSLALELTIFLKMKKVYLLGVDMAYPGGASHAEGTMDKTQKNTADLIPTTGVGGRTVYTDEPFRIYKDAIENRIKETPQIQYINLSQIGARIEGTIEEII